MKKWLDAEKKKLDGLSRTKKLEYIWQYYKLWIIGVFCAVFLAGYMTIHIQSANRDTHLYVGFVNTYAQVEENSDFWNEYLKYSGVDMNAENVLFDREMFFDMTKGRVTGNHYYEKLVVLIDGSVLDAVVMEQENLRLFGATGRLMDWNDERLQPLLKKYGDRILTTSVEDENGQRTVPIGIDISDSILMTKTNAYVDGCALGISADAAHIAAVEEFLDYVLTR